MGEKGFYIEPTVFSDVKDDMTMCFPAQLSPCLAQVACSRFAHVQPAFLTAELCSAKEEIFGPVQCISKFSSLDEVRSACTIARYLRIRAS